MNPEPPKDPLFPGYTPHALPVPKHTRLIQKIEEARTDAVCHLTKLEKSRDRAHFIVGGIVLNNPALWALVREGVNAGLPSVGSARKAVNDYEGTTKEIEVVKECLKRT
jgi:hypothetical protein